MDTATFIRNCVSLGYSDKKTATNYAEDHPKHEYTENDYIAAYRASESKTRAAERTSWSVRTKKTLAYMTNSNIYTGAWRW